MAGKGIFVVLKGKGVVAISICYIVTNLACFGLNGLSRENSSPIESTPIAWGPLLYQLNSRTIIWSFPSLSNHPMHWSDMISSIFLHPLIIILFPPHFTSRHPAIEGFLTYPWLDFCALKYSIALNSLDLEETVPFLPILSHSIVDTQTFHE